MKGKTKYGILAMFIVGIFVTAGVATAFGGEMFGSDSAVREQMQASLENGDYNTWINAHNKIFTKEMFTEARERHAVNEKRRESRESIRDAIENEDYQAYQQAVEDLDVEGKFTMIDENDFQTLVELHNAKEAGDYDTVKELRDEIGFEEFGSIFGMAHEHNQGMKHGLCDRKGHGRGFSGQKASN